MTVDQEREGATWHKKDLYEPILEDVFCFFLQYFRHDLISGFLACEDVLNSVKEKGRSATLVIFL